MEESLRRLGTDRIDLYQIHRPEQWTDVEETLGALTDLQRQGKIRYFGSSTFPGWQVVEAQWVAERRGLSRFRTEQPPYSIFVRSIEHDVLPVAQRYGMGVLVWSPLNRGWLAGRYRRRHFDRSPESRAVRGAQRAEWLALLYDESRPEVQRKLDVVEELAGSPSGRAPRSRASRSRSCSPTRRSPRRSSGRARRSSSRTCWMPRTSGWTTRRSTRSTRSSRRERWSTSATAGSIPGGSVPRLDGRVRA